MAEKGEGRIPDVIESAASSSSTSEPSSQGTSSHGQPLENQEQQPMVEMLPQWKPNEELLNQLIEMGINENVAEKSLFFSGNNSIEHATNWIFENEEESDQDLPLTDYQKAGGQFIGPGPAFTDELKQRAVREMFKMVFVVNSNLDMGIGKIAAQVAHSAIALHSILLQNESKFGDFLLKWFEFGETKIILKGDTSKQLIDLQSMATVRGIPCYLVQDAGKTQVPKGSVTVLALFGRVDIVDTITGNLKLL